LPSLYAFGNAPRNAAIGPGLAEFDWSLHSLKNFGKISSAQDSRQLQLALKFISKQAAI
jgi:hypothetical protein